MYKIINQVVYLFLNKLKLTLSKKTMSNNPNNPNASTTPIGT